MMNFQKQSKVSKHAAISEWQNKAAQGCKGTGVRVRAGTCTRALFQRPFCIVPPTLTASGVLCSKQLVLQHFVIDFATVLTSDINSRKTSTAFSCSALSLIVWEFIPVCRQTIVIAQVLQYVYLMLYADGEGEACWRL